MCISVLVIRTISYDLFWSTSQHQELFFCLFNFVKSYMNFSRFPNEKSRNSNGRIMFFFIDEIHNLYCTRDRCTVAFSITKLKCVSMNDRASPNERKKNSWRKKKLKKIKLKKRRKEEKVEEKSNFFLCCNVIFFHFYVFSNNFTLHMNIFTFVFYVGTGTYSRERTGFACSKE